MIDVSSLLGGVIPLSTVTVRAFAASTQNAYRETVIGTTTASTRTIPVHPATSRRLLERLREIDRKRETIALYDSPSSPLVAAAGCAPSEVDYRGRTYVVTHVGDYAEQGEIMLVLASLKDATL